MQTTTNYGFKLPEDNEVFDQQDHANWNIDQIDTALTPTADPMLAFPEPMSNGPHKIGKWVSWIAKMIKSITGKTNWYDAPSKTLEDVNSDLSAHMADTMPHRFVDGGITYRWGLSVVSGVVTFNYEEVS